MLLILRTVFWYVYFAVSLLATLPVLNGLIRKKGRLNKNEYETLINKKAQKWSNSQVRNSGARVRIIGEENIPVCPVVFVANHQSNFDIALFLAKIKKNKGFVAKMEMLKVPVLNKWMRELNCVFMDRNDMKQSLKAILSAVEIVKNGYSMVIFPEGTRAKNGGIQEFKAGSFKLATKSRAPIVPVTISGTYRLMEANNNKIRPADVYMTIHKPINTANLTKDEENALPDTVRDIIASAL